MTMTIQRLNERVRATLTAHFLALPLRDRCLRFGTSLAPTAVASYVDRIDFDRDAVLGVHDDYGALVGAAHVAFEGELAELGLSVLPMYRRRGMGTALFKHALAHARNGRVAGLIMHFLRDNQPIMRIARRFRMNIVADACDARAHLDLPLAPPTLFAVESATEAFARNERARGLVTA